MAGYILEIHHIDVRGGDATAIRLLNATDQSTVPGSKVLIDSGAVGSGVSRLSGYLNTHFGTSGALDFDYLVASHYHDDHILGFTYSPSGASGGTNSKPLFGAAQIVHLGFDSPNGYGHKTRPNYVKQYTALYGKLPAVPIPFLEKDGKKEPVVLALPQGVKLTCYCAGGILADGTNVLASKRNKADLDANDLSLAFLLEWRGFRYFTAGDLSGADTSSYNDVETPFLKYLVPKLTQDPPVHLLKVTHHGSDYSTHASTDSQPASGFLDQLRPETLVIQVNQDKGVPGAKFYQRLSDYVADRRTRSKKDTHVFFLNDLNYSPKRDKARYDGLQGLLGNVGKGLVTNIDTLSTPPRLIQYDAAAVIARVGDLPKSPTLGADDRHVAFPDYEIIVRNSEAFKESKADFQKASPSDEPSLPIIAMADLNENDDDAGKKKLMDDARDFETKSIFPGFEDIADRFAADMAMDIEESKTIAEDYYGQNYPSVTTDSAVSAALRELRDAKKDQDQFVAKKKNLRQAALTQILAVYSNNYTYATFVADPKTKKRSVHWRQKKEVSEAESTTLERLLIENKYQPEVARLVSRKRGATEFWNDQDRPYPELDTTLSGRTSAVVSGSKRTKLKRNPPKSPP